MVAPNMYEYSMEAQNSFDLFAFRSPPIQSPRDNIKRSLPIYDGNEDQDVEVVPERQHLDKDIGEDEEEYKVEDEDKDVGEVSNPKEKEERQSFNLGRNNKKRP
ncbi:hypothetical protein Hanom_Chr09g00805291 [Helianthus anomalus]